MPTKNRRVATYLPKEIDDRLESFKADRGIEGDSQALIVILSEFLGVSQNVAYASELHSINWVSIENLDEKINQLKSELLSELSNRLLAVGEKFQELEIQLHALQRVRTEVKDELLNELKSELPQDFKVPGQLELISESEIFASESNIDESESEQLSELSSEANAEYKNELVEDVNQIKELPGIELSKRLKVQQPALSAQSKKSEDEFAKWTKGKDPSGVAWRKVGRGRYTPLLN